MTNGQAAISESIIYTQFEVILEMSEIVVRPTYQGSGKARARSRMHKRVVAGRNSIRGSHLLLHALG